MAMVVQRPWRRAYKLIQQWGCTAAGQNSVVAWKLAHHHLKIEVERHGYTPLRFYQQKGEDQLQLCLEESWLKLAQSHRPAHCLRVNSAWIQCELLEWGLDGVSNKQICRSQTSLICFQAAESAPWLISLQLWGPMPLKRALQAVWRCVCPFDPCKQFQDMIKNFFKTEGRSFRGTLWSQISNSTTQWSETFLLPFLFWRIIANPRSYQHPPKAGFADGGSTPNF